jgi:2-dehydro-3-deoxygluconokinase
MVRLSPPGHGRIEFANTLEVCVGGGEYNVAYGLARLGLRAGFISRLVDNPVGRIILNHARAAGLDVSHVLLAPYDGVGRADRVGLNFTEVGTGVRPSVTLYDRGHSAASHLRPGMIDFEKVFRDEGVRWLHAGAIFPALSEGCAAVCREALAAARAAGVVTSYDLNFRSALSSLDEARRVTRSLMPYVDVLIGNDGIIRALAGQGGGAEESRAFDPPAYRKTVAQLIAEFPNVTAVGTTVRTVRSGLVNDWQGVLQCGGTLYESRPYRNLEIEDRVGGGDGFCAGLIYGMLAGKGMQECVELAAAHGALLHTTRGDTSQVTLEELLHVAGGGGAEIRR